MGVSYTAHCHPHPPDSSANHALERRKLGALTWLLCDPSTPVGAQTSRHHWQHAEGVNHAVACRLPPANTRNPLPHCPAPASKTTKSNIRGWLGRGSSHTGDKW